MFLLCKSLSASSTVRATTLISNRDSLLRIDSSRRLVSWYFSTMACGPSGSIISSSTGRRKSQVGVNLLSVFASLFMRGVFMAPLTMQFLPCSLLAGRQMQLG